MQLLARGIQAGYAAVGGAVRLATGRAGSARERKRPGMPAGRGGGAEGLTGEPGPGSRLSLRVWSGERCISTRRSPSQLQPKPRGFPLRLSAAAIFALTGGSRGRYFRRTSEQVRPARTPPVVPPGRVPGPRGHLSGSEHRWCRWGGGGGYPPRRPGCRQRDAPHRGGDWRAVATDRGRGVVPAGDGRGAARPGNPSAGRPRGGAHGSGLRPPGPGRGPQLPDRQGRVAYRRVGDPRWDQHQARALVERLLAAR